MYNYTFTCQNSSSESQLCIFVALDCKIEVNPFGEGDEFVVHLYFAKNGLAKRSKKCEAKLRFRNKMR